MAGEEKMEDLLDLIKTSFLKQSQKDELINYLNTRGADDAFFQTFNRFLIEETESRAETYRRSVQELDSSAKNLEKEFEEKKKQIEMDTEKKLAAIDPSDISAKEKIWEEYEKSLTKLQEEYKETLQYTFSKILSVQYME